MKPVAGPCSRCYVPPYQNGHSHKARDSPSHHPRTEAMRERAADSPPHLTKEQDEQRLRGLRALARLIVRAHLAAVAGAEPSPEEDDHAK